MITRFKLFENKKQDEEIAKFLGYDKERIVCIRKDDEKLLKKLEEITKDIIHKNFHVKYSNADWQVVYNQNTKTNDLYVIISLRGNDSIEKIKELFSDVFGNIDVEKLENDKDYFEYKITIKNVTREMISMQLDFDLFN